MKKMMPSAPSLTPRMEIVKDQFSVDFHTCHIAFNPLSISFKCSAQVKFKII
jgi:hypothetical protein